MKKKQSRIVKSICNKYLRRGVESVILGCTELSLMIKEQNKLLINTIDLLVRAVINKLN